MYEQSLVTPRQVLRYGLLLVGIIAISWFIWFVFTHGGINVKTKAVTAEISIAPENDEAYPTKTKKGNGLFSFLKNGRYIVTVKDGKKQTKTAVQISAFDIKEVTLTPPDIAFSEAVTNIPASAFAASSTTLSLLDSSNEEIASIGSDGLYKHTDSTVAYESTVWLKAGEGYAIGRSRETDDRILAKITNGTVAIIAAPKPITSQTYLAFNYSIDGTFYIVQDGELYKTTSSGYERVGTLDKKALILSISSRYVAVLLHNEDVCEIQFMKLADKTIKKKSVECVQSPSYNYSAVWSPDEKKLAFTTGKSLEILDENLTTKATLPDYAATNPIWRDATTVIYTSGNNIWSYDTSTATTSVIASTPEYVDVQALRKADDSDMLYFSGAADNQLTLYRVQSKGDELSDIQKFSESNTQELSAVCYAHYSNLSKPQLILSTAESTRADCASEAKSYLSSIGASIDSYQYDIREELGYTDGV